MNTVLLLLFFTAMMRMILLSFNHYHVSDKVNNFQMVLMGAKARPDYWFVLLLDLSSTILFSFVIFAAFRYRYVVTDQVRFFNFLPSYLLTGSIFILFASIFRQLFRGNQNWKQKIFWGLVALFTGLLFIVSFVFSASVLQMGHFQPGLELLRLLNGRAWILPSILWTGLIGIALFVSTFLRVIPLVGDYLYVVLHEGLVLLAFERAATFLLRPISYQPITLQEVCLCNLRPFYLGLSIFSVFLFLLITMYSDEKEKENRRMPPALILDEKLFPHPILTSNADTAVLQGQKTTIIVRKQPFEIEIKNGDTQAILLNSECISRRLIVSQDIMIPYIFPANIFRVFWQKEIKNKAVVRQFHVLDNRLQIDLESGLQLMFSLFQEDVIQIEIIDKGRRIREFSGLMFELPMKTTDHLMGLDQFGDAANLRVYETGEIVEVGRVNHPSLRNLFSTVFSGQRKLESVEPSVRIPIPVVMLKQAMGVSVGMFNETFSPCWLDFREDRGVQICQVGNRINLFLCLSPTLEEVVETFSEMITKKIQFQRFTNSRSKDSETSEKSLHEAGGFEGFPYVNIRSEQCRLGLRNGYLVKNQLGLPYLQQTKWGNAGLVDFTNAEACQWYSEIVKKSGNQHLLSDIDFYCVSIPPDAVFQNGLDAAEMQNAYPVMALDCVQTVLTTDANEMKDD